MQGRDVRCDNNRCLRRSTEYRLQPAVGNVFPCGKNHSELHRDGRVRQFLKLQLPGDDNNLTDAPAVSVPVVQEDATPTYSGGTYFSTANSSSYTATIALSGTATDSSDGNRGDIRNAKMEFHRDSPTGALLGAGNLPV